jgi:hypothetical protein
MPQTSTTSGLLKKLIPAILFTGLLAGTMDGLAAITNYSIQGGKKPEVIFKYIASGAVGKKALEGGIEMILLGVVFHFLIAFVFTILFFWLYKTNWLPENKVVAGLAYGAIVWIVMNLFIVPISLIGKETINIPKGRIELLILMVCIGLPISLMANKHYLYKK